MKNLVSSKNFSLNKSTYVNLRWIAILGQLLTINSVKFIFQFEFNFILANIIVLFGALSNILLIYIFKKTQLSEKVSLYFLTLDIFQLSFLLYLTGGTINPFSIFVLLPSIFAASSLNLRSNLFLISITFFSILILSFYHYELPSPLNQYIFSKHYYYAVPISLTIALGFLNYFAFSFGKESRLHKDAIDKLQEVMAKEHELVSLGGQAAAAAHSLGTPLSTIKIISHELSEELKNNEEVRDDLKLLVSQVDRCNKILKKLTLNPAVEDDFIDKDLSLNEYINQIVKSFEEISEKTFFVNLEQDYNPIKIKRSIELIYGIRNFIGNANKFAHQKIYITVKSDSETSEITIEDDGNGFHRNILNKIGEPYLKSTKDENNATAGLGLGIFIGKTLLEKNFSKVVCRNSLTRKGAEVSIKWENKFLKKI